MRKVSNRIVETEMPNSSDPSSNRNIIHLLADLKVVVVPLASVTSYASHARKHPRSQIEKLARNISSFGFLIPLLVDENRHVICGEARLAAAMSLGLSDVPVISVSHLTDAEIMAFRTDAA